MRCKVLFLLIVLGGLFVGLPACGVTKDTIISEGEVEGLWRSVKAELLDMTPTEEKVRVRVLP